MKKTGFLKTTESKVIIGILATVIVIIALIVIICGLLIYLITTPQSGESLFEMYILEPVPESVQIIDSYDGIHNLDPDECVHFAISPEDFQLILESRDWEIVPEGSYLGADCMPSTPPPSLGEDVLIYYFVPREKVEEVIFTNSEMNEVYYSYLNLNRR